ncbi:uncharacterized protein V6R79_015464 [Siganus canaliculatus]
MEDGGATTSYQISELAGIKELLQGIAADVSSMKAGLETLQATVEKLGTRMEEAENRISDLEDVSNSRNAALNSAMINLKKLQDKVTYLDDAGRRNNVRVTGIAENAEKQDLAGFVLTLLAEQLEIDINEGFELERIHRVGPRREDRNRHILVRFLRFSAREAVLRAARRKGRVEWQGKRISFFQDLSQDVLQLRRKFDAVKKQLQERDLPYSMLYPATLKVSVNNRAHTFTSPEAAVGFLAAQG